MGEWTPGHLTEVNILRNYPCGDLPDGLVVKTVFSNAGGVALIPGQRHGNPLQYSCLENPHGQRSLAGHSPWGHKELDMTELQTTAHRKLRSLEPRG